MQIKEEIEIKEEPFQQHTRSIKPQSLKKTASLEEAITRFLELQFGETQIVNLKPLTESIEPSKLAWSINVDGDEATLTVMEDGSFVANSN